MVSFSRPRGATCRSGVGLSVGASWLVDIFRDLWSLVTSGVSVVRTGICLGPITLDVQTSLTAALLLSTVLFS